MATTTHEATGEKTNGTTSNGATRVAESVLDLPTSTETERLVRARGTTFLVTDRQGDITPPGARELGLFHADTRHLSHYALTVRAAPLVRLSADAAHPAYNQIDLMLSDTEREEILDDPRNFLHIRRRQLLDHGLVEEIVFTNFLPRPVTLEVLFQFGADFADIFEVRGARRPKRGVLQKARVETRQVILSYKGLDGSTYTTTLGFHPEPTTTAADHALYELSIPNGESLTIEIRVLPARDTQGVFESLPFRRRVDRIAGEAEAFREASTTWTTDDGRLQGFFDQGEFDLHALRVRIGQETIVGAGIPWFCAPFGRDSLIAAYEALTLNPSLATEALRTLAAYQGKKYDARTEEEPGKIFHELRFGEMVRAGEIPHAPYYGSIDSTPLFVVLAHAAHLFVNDRAFLQGLRPSIEAALGWIDTRSELGTKPVTYQRKDSGQLHNQGWKDSRAGVSFPDGRRAEPPIALCEVQGYCIDAYRRGAQIFEWLGDPELAKTYAARAVTMAEMFEHHFWMAGAERYAYALDGRGTAVPTIVSNLGHLLWSCAVRRERGASVARALLASNMYAGFGIRTLASDQPVYNPLSYHNGTVWPHDNALIAMGLASYGCPSEAIKVFEGLYAAMGFFRERQLPELFCGIGRRSGPLVRYPVACSPQAWAAAAPFLLVQAMLGIHADAPANTLIIRNPTLPKLLSRLEFRGMRVGNAVVSARFRRVGGRCHVDVLDVTGGPLRTQIEMH